MNNQEYYKIHLLIRCFACVILFVGAVCCTSGGTKSKGQVSYYQFPEGKIAHFTLRNKNGMEVKVMNYGATITHISVPDVVGRMDDVILGFDSIRNYITGVNPFFGCVVGRYANRIANAQFVLNGDTVKLTANSNGNSSHGGKEGFNRKIWSIEAYTDSSLVLSYYSPDGEEGFPGNLEVELTYTVSPENELIIDYLASTDKPTPVSLTNHSYFNLSGGKEATVLDHEVYLNADAYTEVDDQLIPTGKIVELEGGPMDFSRTSRKRIGQDIKELVNGYDHNWILNKSKEKLSLAAVVYEPVSGRGLEVRTTMPGIQFYTGNFLNPGIVGKRGVEYEPQAGFCLETQYFPDSPNHSNFPSAILSPNEKYAEKTIYKFFVH